jgi:hypothetical protein
MGKGNRSRQDRALQAVKESTVEAAPLNVRVKTIIATSVVAFLIIGCILLSVIVNTGIVLRTKTAAKTDNFDVSGTVMSYLVYSQAQSMAYYYQQMGLNYGVSEIISTFGINYFANSVLAQVKEMLVLCEYAKANGISLSDEDKTNIDAYIDSIKEAAAKELYSTNAYVKLMYGNGVNINDIREALELSYLSDAARKVIREKLQGDVTDELRNKYIEDNPQYFYFADYLTFTYTAKLVAKGAEATEEEKKAYEDKKTEMKALATALEAAKSADEFNDLVIDYIVNTVLSESFDSTFESKYKENCEKDKCLPNAEALKADKAAMLAEISQHLKDIYTDLVTEDEEEEKEEEKKEEDKKDEVKSTYQKALEELKKTLTTSAEKEYEGVVVIEHAHFTPVEEGKEDKTSELDKWIFNKDTKAGATKLIEKVGDTTSTYNVSFLKSESALDDKISTYDVAHILVKFEISEGKKEPTEAQKEAAKAEAQAILDQYLAGEKTREAFEALGKEKTDDSNVVYEGVSLGQMVEPFEDWAIDEARKEGDTGLVETEYGYHVMYYIDSALTSENGVLSDLYSAWIEEEATKTHYTFKQSVIDSIK